MTWASGTLREDSEIYHERAGVYDELSRAEDADGAAIAFLRAHLRGKDVLDIGCGTGKYLELLSSDVRRICGVDAAAPQAEIARRRCASLPNVSIVHGDALGAELPHPRYDAAIACWMLGTVADPAKRLAIVERAGRLVGPGGLLLLIENGCGGAFEDVRGRHGQTASYNRWLAEEAGLRLAATFASRFRFPSAEDSSRVIGAIWGPQAGDRAGACGAEIPHSIAAFSRRF